MILSFVWCSTVLFLSSFTVVVGLSKSTTCLHFHTFIYSKYDVVKRFPITSITLNYSLSNLILSSQRLVTMSVSLRTQTVLHCLILQVLNIRVCFQMLDTMPFTSVHSNLEHGLAILTESFSPLRSVLHNLSEVCAKLCDSLLYHVHLN